MGFTGDGVSARKYHTRLSLRYNLNSFSQLSFVEPTLRIHKSSIMNAHAPYHPYAKSSLQVSDTYQNSKQNTTRLSKHTLT